MSTLLSKIEPLSNATIVNVASVRQISPFRYPGGKTWLVPTFSTWLKRRSPRPRVLVDPFVGGGSIPLGILAEGLVDKIVIGEIDAGVSSVWQCALSSQNEELCKRIDRFRISRASVEAELERIPQSSVDRAFQTILRNRTFRGGILAPGASLMKQGENGHGVASRWYPQTLIKRLHSLRALSSFIEFHQQDAFDLIERFIQVPDVAYFFDPPYTAGDGKRAGKRLYLHNKVDHSELFKAASRATGLVVMTYDDCPDVIRLAKQSGLSIERVPMKNTHHDRKFELLISNLASTV